MIFSDCLITHTIFDKLYSTEGTHTGKEKMIVLTQTALKRLLTHTSLNLKILSENDTSSSSTTTSASSNSTQNSLNLAHLSQKNYIQELQKEKVFASLGILVLNFSQVLSSIKNGKKRKQIRNDGATEEGTEERKGENENEDKDGGEGEEGEGEGEGGDNDDDDDGAGDEDDPCDLLPTVDLIISILAHVVASEVRYRLYSFSDIS